MNAGSQSLLEYAVAISKQLFNTVLRSITASFKFQLRVFLKDEKLRYSIIQFLQIPLHV